MTKRLTRNAAKCLWCGDVIESKYRHNYVSCSCGSLFVDGGLDYQRLGYHEAEGFINLAEYEEVADDD